MEDLKKPESKSLSLWRVRLFVISFIPSFLSAYFSQSMGWVWILLTSVWILAFLYFYFFYYPIKYKKLFYGVQADRFVLHCGVIYTRVKAVPKENIQYTEVTCTPLQYLFGVRSIHVHAAGAVMIVSGISVAAANELQQQLTPKV